MYPPATTNNSKTISKNNNEKQKTQEEALMRTCPLLDRSRSHFAGCQFTVQSTWCELPEMHWIHAKMHWSQMPTGHGDARVRVVISSGSLELLTVSSSRCQVPGTSSVRHIRTSGPPNPTLTAHLLCFCFAFKFPSGNTFKRCQHLQLKNFSKRIKNLKRLSSYVKNFQRRANLDIFVLLLSVWL